MTLRRARVLVTFPVAFVGLVPIVVDLSATHALNPDWPPHARLHLVWLVSTNALIVAGNQAGFSLMAAWIAFATWLARRGRG